MTGDRRVLSRWNSAKREVLKALHKPWLAWLLISVFVSCGLIAVKEMRLLQSLELFFYDEMVRRNSDASAVDDRIKIVGMTEADLVKYGFPIDDARLAQVLTNIGAQNPCVVGLDMYRDLPEPRDKSLYPQLSKVLLEDERVIAIERVGFVKGPPALTEGDDPRYDRIAANNFPKDAQIDGVYRRGVIALEDKDTDPYPSLSFVLTIHYLQARGIEWELNPETRLLRLGKTIIPRLSANAGGYVGLNVRDYEFLASYQAPRKYRNNFKRVDGGDEQSKDTSYDYSFGELIEGKLLDGSPLPKDALQDKIVLVATVMESIKDSNPTPVDDNLRGVQQHAMAVHQLLEAAIDGKAPMSWWPDWIEGLFVVASTFVGGALGLFLRSPLKLLPAVAAAICGIGAVVWFLFKGGIWLPGGVLAIGGVLTAAAVTSFVVLLERLDRAKVQMILNKHVSKRVADYIMSHSEHIAEGGMIPARALRATIMFTDLAGFSTASEKLTPEQTLRWLNDYMTVMVKIIEKYEGDVNKYIGDAIMALFGAPIASQDDEGLADDAAKAIQAALEMRAEVPKLNARWRANAPDMPPVAMRVGIFTGPIVDGGFGATDRTEYTVIGDAVNRSNRLEAAGKEIKDQLTEPEKLCTILIGPETFARVGHLFETVAVENLALKGISERATVYRVLSERTQTPNSQPSKS